MHLISWLNNWADRLKFLASFFERRSRGPSAVLSVASGNALSSLCSFWAPACRLFRHAGETRWSRKKGKKGLADGARNNPLNDGAEFDTFPLLSFIVERKLQQYETRLGYLTLNSYGSISHICLIAISTCFMLEFSFATTKIWFCQL